MNITLEADNACARTATRYVRITKLHGIPSRGTAGYLAHAFESACIPGPSHIFSMRSIIGLWLSMLQKSSSEAKDPLKEVLAGSIRSVEYSGGNVYVDAPRQGRIYLPGSFNPLHDGHRSICTSSPHACLCFESMSCVQHCVICLSMPNGHLHACFSTVKHAAIQLCLIIAYGQPALC